MENLLQRKFQNFLSLSSSVGMTPNLNVNIPGSSPTTPPAAGLFAGAGGPNANTLGALVSQHRLLELSRFGLRGYDLAQHMLSQQGAVSKLLGELMGESRTTDECVSRSRFSRFVIFLTQNLCSVLLLHCEAHKSAARVWNAWMKHQQCSQREMNEKSHHENFFLHSFAEATKQDKRSEREKEKKDWDSIKLIQSWWIFSGFKVKLEFASSFSVFFHCCVSLSAFISEDASPALCSTFPLSLDIR